MNLRILSNPRVLWFGWIGLIPVALLLAFMLLYWLPQAAYKGRTVYGERIKLQVQLEQIEKEIKRDLERYTDILKRFPWIIEGAGGTLFLTRLSEVAGGQRLKILAIGSLERNKVGQVEKVGRKVELIGSYSDVVRLVERVEHNRGIMQGLKIEASDLKGRTAARGDLQAQFKMATIELTPDIREKLRSLLASTPGASTGEAKEAGRSLALPAPRIEQGLNLAQSRDPFRAVGMKLAAGAGDSVSPLFPKVTFSGIVSLPDKKAAIINNEMVQEGGRTGEIMVEKITDSEVVLKSGSEVKRMQIPLFAPRHSGKEQER